MKKHRLHNALSMFIFLLFGICLCGFFGQNAFAEAKELPMLSIDDITVVSKNSLRISWTPISKVDGYVIYRLNEEEDSDSFGEMERIATVGGYDSSSYVDENLKYNHTYTYSIGTYKKTKKKMRYSDYEGEQFPMKLSYTRKYSNNYCYYYDSKGDLIKNVEGLIKEPSSYEIRVNTNQCVITVYAKYNSKAYLVPVRSFLCAPGRVTRSGTYRLGVRYRYRVLFYNSYSQWTLHIYGNILFHTSPYTRYQTNKHLDVAEYNKLGTVASHGCVRMQCEGVKWLYDHCKAGTKVVIYRDNKPGPFGKPDLQTLPSWHTWDPTDPTAIKYCKEKGCHQ